MAEQKKSYRALLTALYSIVLFSSGTRTKEVAEAVTDPGIQPFFGEMTYLKEAVASVAKGKSFSTLNLSQGLKEWLMAYKADPSAKPAMVRLLKAFVLYMDSGNEKAWKIIEDNSSSEVFPDWVRTSFTRNVAKQAPLKDKLEKIVQLATGRRGEAAFTSPEEAVAFKEKNPEKYKEYLSLRKQFNSIWKDELSNFARKGDRLVDYESFLKYLDSKSIESTLPTGFTGKIDAAGRIYTQSGEEISGLPSGVLFPTVKMNSDKSGDWVFQAVREDGSGGNYFYTKDFMKKKSGEKFEKVENLSKVFDRVRASWRIGINRYDEHSPQTVAAVILELLYQFNARIGSLGNATDGKATYGLGVCLVKQVSLTPNGFVIRYPGKKGVPAVHKYEGVDPLSKKIVEIVKSLTEGKKPKDFLFTYTLKNGDKKLVQPAVVNMVFKKLGSGGATVHKLRTYRATSIFNDEAKKIFDKIPKIENATKALAIVKKIATLVGKALNHVRNGVGGSKITPNTALSAYIDRAAQVNFFVHYGLPLPNYLAKSKVVTEASNITSTYEEDDEHLDEADVDTSEEELESEVDSGVLVPLLDGTLER